MRKLHREAHCNLASRNAASVSRRDNAHLWRQNGGHLNLFGAALLGCLCYGCLLIAQLIGQPDDVRTVKLLVEAGTVVEVRGLFCPPIDVEADQAVPVEAGSLVARFVPCYPLGGLRRIPALV